jgi:hypothetical protein
MLRIDGREFARGRSRFHDHPENSSEITAKVYVKIGFPTVTFPVLAQLDTGSAYSILDWEVAETLGMLGTGDPAKMHTRQGLIQGHLARVHVVLLADDGDALEMEDCLFFVSEDWTFGNFLGYTGLLDAIRIALDPPLNQFYFGKG